MLLISFLLVTTTEEKIKKTLAIFDSIELLLQKDLDGEENHCNMVLNDVLQHLKISDIEQKCKIFKEMMTSRKKRGIAQNVFEVRCLCNI